MGQLAVLAVVAALVPRRLTVGLLIAIACVVANDYAKTPYARTGAIRAMLLLENEFIALAALAVLQGLRLIFGWRFFTTETADVGPKGQYRLRDLLEWTTTIALCLGSVVWLSRLIRESGRHSGLSFLDCVQPVSQLVLLGDPIVMAVLSKRPLARWRVVALVLWCVSVAMGLFLFDLRHPRVTLQMLLAMAPSGLAPHLLAYLAVIVGNAVVLRGIGYRWRGGSKLSD